MSQTYYAILTAAGEAKLANAIALGTQLQISRMAVGDGNGVLPTPDRVQTALVREQYRADLNSLIPDPLNANQIIAEMVIPETEGGWWLREMGLYDAAGVLIAVSNCPPSYKPQMAEGSGRTQVLRMVLIVSSTAAVQLKIDPSVVLATREFVTTTVAAELAKQDYKSSVLVATTGPIVLNGLQTIDAVALTAGARVLVAHQADAKFNGIYIASAGAWVRAQDADISVEVTPGLLVHIEVGAVNEDSIWQLITNAPITLGTTPLVFEQVAGKTGVVAGTYGLVTVDRFGRVLAGQALPTASETVSGISRRATLEEHIEGLLDNVTLHPAGLRAVLQTLVRDLPFSLFYESAELTWVSAGPVTLNHLMEDSEGNPIAPDLIIYEFRCIETDGGWAVNDKLLLYPPQTLSAADGLILSPNGGQLVGRWGSTRVGSWLRKDTGGTMNAVGSKWRVKVRAFGRAS